MMCHSSTINDGPAEQLNANCGLKWLHYSGLLKSETPEKICSTVQPIKWTGSQQNWESCPLVSAWFLRSHSFSVYFWAEAKIQDFFAFGMERPVHCNFTAWVIDVYPVTPSVSWESPRMSPYGALCLPRQWSIDVSLRYQRYQKTQAIRHVAPMPWVSVPRHSHSSDNQLWTRWTGIIGAPFHHLNLTHNCPYRSCSN